jgi:hypothetical protein
MNSPHCRSAVVRRIQEVQMYSMLSQKLEMIIAQDDECFMPEVNACHCEASISLLLIYRMPVLITVIPAHLINSVEIQFARSSNAFL